MIFPTVSTSGICREDKYEFINAVRKVVALSEGFSSYFGLFCP